MLVRFYYQLLSFLARSRRLTATLSTCSLYEHLNVFSGQIQVVLAGLKLARGMQRSYVGIEMRLWRLTAPSSQPIICAD